MMTDSPLISCIVPTFNSADYVRHALESVFAQTHRPLQVIVADDGSADETVAIVRAFSQPVEVVAQPTAGPAATRNCGLRAARGDFVAFLDADDEWNPEKLARQVARFGMRPDLDVCLSHVRLLWSAALAGEEARFRDHPRAATVPGYASTTMLARRSLFDLVGEFDRELWFADATDWFLRAAERGLRIEMLAEVLTYHRMHGSNLTRRRSAASREEFLDVIKRSLDRRRGRQHAGTGPRTPRAAGPN
jgi:glycosyltransferase involved in cell wall biosynthesis